MDMNLSKLLETVKDRGVWCAAVLGVTKSWTRLNSNPQHLQLLLPRPYSGNSIAGRTVSFETSPAVALSLQETVD